MNFYANYVNMCNRVGKTPSAVALEIGISKPTISKWKKGGGVTDATAAKVAAYFGVPVAELTCTAAVVPQLPVLDLEEKGKKNKPADDGELAEKRLMLIDYVRSVPADKLDLYLRVMKSIVEDSE